MLASGRLPAESHETDAASPTSLPFPLTLLAARELTTEEQERLGRDTELVSAFKQQKLEEEAQRNWDLFYKRNTTKFFKDRHWTTHEFKELCDKKVSFVIRRVPYVKMFTDYLGLLRFFLTVGGGLGDGGQILNLLLECSTTSWQGSFVSVEKLLSTPMSI